MTRSTLREMITTCKSAFLFLLLHVEIRSLWTSKKEQHSTNGYQDGLKQQSHSWPLCSNRSHTIILHHDPDSSTDATKRTRKCNNEPHSSLAVATIIKDRRTRGKLTDIDKIHENVGDTDKDGRKSKVPPERSSSRRLVGTNDTRYQNEPPSRKESS